MIVVFKLDCGLEVDGLPQVVLIAVEEYHVDVGVELGNIVVAILVNFLLDGPQIHRHVHDRVVIRHALALRIDGHSEGLRRPMVLQPLDDVVAELFLLLVQPGGRLRNRAGVGQAKIIAQCVFL